MVAGLTIAQVCRGRRSPGGNRSRSSCQVSLFASGCENCGEPGRPRESRSCSTAPSCLGGPFNTSSVTRQFFESETARYCFFSLSLSETNSLQYVIMLPASVSERFHSREPKEKKKNKKKLPSRKDFSLCWTGVFLKQLLLGD